MLIAVSILDSPGVGLVALNDSRFLMSVSKTSKEAGPIKASEPPAESDAVDDHVDAVDDDSAEDSDASGDPHAVVHAADAADEDAADDDTGEMAPRWQHKGATMAPRWLTRAQSSDAMS